MYEGKVVKAFIDRHTRRVHNPADTYRSQDLERMEHLASLGHIEFDGPQVALNQDPNLNDVGADPDADPDQDPSLKHVGGGYYELPNGTKVRGKEAAVAALAELKAPGSASESEE